jgi:hypothetical protein
MQFQCIAFETAAVHQLGLFCSGDVCFIGRLVYHCMQGVGFGIVLRLVLLFSLDYQVFTCTIELSTPNLEHQPTLDLNPGPGQ